MCIEQKNLIDIIIYYTQIEFNCKKILFHNVGYFIQGFNKYCMIKTLKKVSYSEFFVAQQGKVQVPTQLGKINAKKMPVPITLIKNVTYALKFYPL